MKRVRTLAILIYYDNDRCLVGECLESLFRVQKPDCKVIIFDNFSMHPASNYIPHEIEPYVKIKRAKHRLSSGAARNLLLSMSNAEYIHCHDASDRFAKNWYAEIFRVLELTNPPDLIVTKFESVLEDTVLDNGWPGNLFHTLNVEERLVRLCIIKGFPSSCCTYLKTRAVDVGGYDEGEELAQPCEYGFHMRLALKVRSSALIEDKLVFKQWKPRQMYSDDDCHLDGIALKYQLKTLIHLEDELISKYQYNIVSKLAKVSHYLFVNKCIDDCLEGLSFVNSLNMHLQPPKHCNAIFRLLYLIFGPKAVYVCLWKLHSNDRIAKLAFDLKNIRFINSILRKMWIKKIKRST